nr:hypothetical protein [Crepidula fornicata]
MPTLKVVASLLICACAVSACQGWFGGASCCNILPSVAEYRQCITCTLFKTKEVTLRIKNILRDPNFDESVTLKCTRSKTLFYMMQEAADINKKFRPTVKYFGTPLGFFVQAINGLFGNYTADQSFWEILDGNNQQTSVGVSSYVPKNGETVTFNFTQGTH